MDLAIILVAAGQSTRMGFPKLWADLAGRPVVEHAVAAACKAAPGEIILVVTPDRVGSLSQLGVRVVPGGARRRDSVAAGLEASTASWLAIHDAARALAPADLYARGLAAAQRTGAAIPVLPLKDTIKRIADGLVVETPSRSEHAVVQTPQVFRRDVLLRALASTEQDVTDEATLVEQVGVAVATFEGNERAFKITTPLDLVLARTLVSPRTLGEG
jgi:2-C-methyl-D-erythritol 4-phosphate cytidylyltransferase / 2-C-methyl-D-erythritol 2,4-cyclodiphosphate synthase